MRTDAGPGDRALAIAERAALSGVAAGCVLTVIGAAIAIFLLTAELDEAWLLYGFQAFFRAPPPGLEIPVVLTSGGPYAVIHLAITWLASGELWLHRAVSWLCLLIALLITVRWATRETGSRAAGILCCGALAATPGAIMMGSLALAEPLALLLLFAFVETWSTGETPARRFALGGVLLGLACATRAATLPAVPALAVFWLLRSDRTLPRLLETVATGAVAVLVFGACQWSYMIAAPGDAPTLSYVLGVTGASGASHTDWVAIVNRLVLGGHLMPLGLAAAALVGGYCLARTPGAPFGTKPLLLACLGLSQLLLWVWVSPIPLLRYAWPGLAAVWLALGMVIAAAFAHARGADSLATRLALSCLVAGSLASELAAGARVVAYGESTLVSAEYAGFSGLARYDAFEAAANQNAAVRFLKENVSGGERVFVFHLPFELAYLTGLDVSAASSSPTAPRWLVLTPTVGEQVHLSISAIEWIEGNCDLRARFGNYAIYRIRGEFPLTNRWRDDLPSHFR